MGIYIKGMEMPKGGYRTIEIAYDADGHPMALADDGDVFDVISVSSHGRLIDADALAKRIKDEGRNQAEYYADRYAPVVMAYGDCYGKVQSAPTIIPVEQKGE